MNQSAVEDYTPVVFVDTNAVHYARLLLAFAGEHGLDPFNHPFERFRVQLSRSNVRTPTEYSHGYWLVRYLRQRCDDGGRLYYSRITTLELRYSSLRATALLRAATARVPHRWYSRLEERDIRLHLGTDGYAEVFSEYDEVEQRFADASISIDPAEFDVDVWCMAETILQNVFLDVQDALVYASAVMAQSSELITADGYLGETVAYTENPGGAAAGLGELFAAVRDAVMARYCELTGTTAPVPILPVRMTFGEMERILAEDRE